jgi:hypothetical protein
MNNCTGAPSGSVDYGPYIAGGFALLGAIVSTVGTVFAVQARRHAYAAREEAVESNRGHRQTHDILRSWVATVIPISWSLSILL